MFVQLPCHTRLAGSVLLQELVYKCGVTWSTLALVLLYCSNAAVPRCCQGDDFAAMLLPWFCFGFGVLLPLPVAMQLLCGFCLAALLFSVLVSPSGPTLTCV